MTTPLKFDHDKRPYFRFQLSDSRAHYQDLAVHILKLIVQRRQFIAWCVGIALVLAAITIPMLPRKYSAEALIYPNLFSRDQGKGTAIASVDAATFVTGEARLLHSDAFLRGVAKRLGDEGLNSIGTQRLGWIRAAWLPETRNYSPFDRLVTMLRNKVGVMNDTRSYLISVAFTASSAEEAAQVVNSFVLEYVHDKAVQRRLDRVASAEADLREQRTVYGEKHPKTLQAVAELDAARAALDAMTKSPASDQDEIAGGQGVKLAEPNQTPTSPNGFVILVLSLLAGLIGGIGLVVWIDHREAALRR
jgi:uncharacterized protein involved in exopolysaccharide biosynthesis